MVKIAKIAVVVIAGILFLLSQHAHGNEPGNQWVKTGMGFETSVGEMRVGVTVIQGNLTYYAHTECPCSPYTEKLVWTKGESRGKMVNCSNRPEASYLPPILERLINVRYPLPTAIRQELEGRISSVGI